MKSNLIFENFQSSRPQNAQLQILIEANTTVGKKTKNLPIMITFAQWPFYIKMFFQTTTCSRYPLLSGPKSGCLIQV